MAISPITYIATFSGRIYFWRSYFFKVNISTQQLIYRSSYFFRAAAFLEEILFQNSHLFTAVIFSEQLLFQSKVSTEQTLFEGKKFFGAVTFWDSCIFGGGFVQNKDIYRKFTFSKQVLLNRIKFFKKSNILEKPNFSEKQYSGLPTFYFLLEPSLLQKTLPSIAATFSEELFFFNIYFQKNCKFHRYASFPQLKPVIHDHFSSFFK